MSQQIAIFGASSAIAMEVAKIYAKDGETLHLISRSAEKLDSFKKDLKIRGAAQVFTYSFDFEKDTKYFELLENILGNTGGKIHVSLIAYGTLPKQDLCEKNLEETLKVINLNGVSTISLLHHLANLYELWQGGTIATISSVAGDRGRPSNYTYGTAKSMVSTYMQGLRGRLNSAGVQVLTIKPGFVDSPMTAEFEKGPLWAKPQDIAQGIVNAIKGGRNIVYLPFFWLFIMLIVRHIPEFIFKKLKI